MFDRLLRWYTIYSLSGALAPGGIVPGAKFTLCPIFAVLLHGPAAGVSHFVAWYKECNYGTLAEGATHIWLRGHHVGYRPKL